MRLVRDEADMLGEITLSVAHPVSSIVTTNTVATKYGTLFIVSSQGTPNAK
jgi:hypothetical protein